MKKILVVMLIVLSLTAGCSTTGTKKDSELVVYTNSNSDGRGDWWIKEAKEAGFKINIVGAGGADLTNRLIAEKNNPTADVVFGLNSMLYEFLKAEDILDVSSPKWKDEVEEHTNDPEGFYHSLVKQALVLVYNEEKWTSETAPLSLTDLATNDAFKGEYEATTQLSQITPQIILSSILVQHIDEAGDLNISDEGWKLIEQYYKNGVYTIEGEDFYSSAIQDKLSIGVVVSGTMKAKLKENNLNLGIVSPEIGTPTIIEHIALVKGSKNQESAKEFIDWFGSEEMQSKFAEEFNAMPTNLAAKEKANDEVIELYKGIKNQELDWKFIADNIGAWMEKIELEILD